MIIKELLDISLVLSLLVVIFLIYGVFVIRDIILIGRILNNVGEQSRVGKNKIRFSTSLGEFLLQRIENVEYRLDSLHWQIKAEALREVKIPSPEWWGSEAELASKKGGDLGGEVLFLHRVLEFVRREFRGTACAFLLEEPDNSVQFVTNGINNVRFEENLLNLLRPYFLSGDTSSTGVLDASTTHSIYSDISIFGFRYSVIFPFYRDAKGSADHRARAALWIGYPANKEPHDLEVQAAQDLCAKVEMYLQTFGKVITLSEKVAEAEVLNKQKSDFIAHMSHDIRSPLNNIKAILSLFRVELSNPDLLEMLEAAMRNCDSLGEIVEDILDFSRAKEGRLSAEAEVVILSTCVSEVVESFKFSARGKGLKLNVDLGEDEYGVYLDKKHLRRILINLVGNAIKYTKFGEVSVKIERKGEQGVRVVVKDTGLGLREEALKSLFKPFARFHEGFEGVGLGLTLTKVLTELNKGTISVSSVAGQGFEFAVQFDAVPLGTLEGVEEGVTMPEVGEDDKIRVLLVDDNLDCVDSLGRILERENFKVFKASSVRDAISICNFESPDIIITDCNMPHGGGRKLINFARTTMIDISIAVLSGSDGTSHDQLLVDGADRVFSKPAEIPTIVEWIRSMKVGAREIPRDKEGTHG